MSLSLPDQLALDEAFQRLLKTAGLPNGLPFSLSSLASGGNILLAPVGSSPNANAATASGMNLTLQPADGSNPGILTIGAQDIAGAKNFTGGLTGITFSLSGAMSALEYRTSVTNGSVNFKAFTGAGPGAPAEFIFDTTAAPYTYDINTSWRANGVEVANVNNNGTIGTNSFQSGLVSALNQWGQIQLRQTGAPTSGKAGFYNPYGATRLSGTPGNSATDLGVRLGSDTNLTAVGSRLVEHANNGDVIKSYISKDGMFGCITGGAADVVGTATLVGGTVTVATTAIRAGSKVFLSRNTPGGTLGQLSAPVASIVAATSFVINSSSGAETSTVNWFLVDTN